jgi:hypothetical protein
LLESLQSLVEDETGGVEDDGIHDSIFVCSVALSDMCALLTEWMRESKVSTRRFRKEMLRRVARRYMSLAMLHVTRLVPDDVLLPACCERFARMAQY